VKVRPRLPEQLEPVRQADRDEPRQHRRRREPHPARGREDGDVKGTRLSRREVDRQIHRREPVAAPEGTGECGLQGEGPQERDRKSTRLNSSQEWMSYAVYCLINKQIM